MYVAAGIDDALDADEVADCSEHAKEVVVVAMAHLAVIAEVRGRASVGRSKSTAYEQE